MLTALLLWLSALALRLWGLATDRTLSDDAYIVMRVARNIGTGVGFVYNAGSHEQACTSLLWGAIAGVTWKFFGDITPTIMQIVGGLVDASVVLVLALGFSGSSDRRQSSLIDRNKIAPLFAAALYAFGSPAVLVSTKGLETGLYALVLTLCLGAMTRGKGIQAAVFAGSAFAVRPDGALAGLVVLLWSWMRNRSVPWRQLFVLAVFGLVVGGSAVLLFGSAVPQTAIAKRLIERHPLDSLASFLGPLFFNDLSAILLGVFASVGIGMSCRLAERRFAAVSLWFGTYVAAISTQSTWWPWYRPPAIAAYSILAGLGFAACVHAIGTLAGRRVQRAVGVAIMVVVSCALIIDVRTKTVPFAQKQAYYESQRQEVARVIEASTQRDATVMLEPLGIVGFYCDRTFLDYPGVVSRRVTDAIKRFSTSISGKPIDPAMMTAILSELKPTILVLRRDELDAIRAVVTLAGYTTLVVVRADEAITRKYPDFQNMTVLARPY